MAIEAGGSEYSVKRGGRLPGGKLAAAVVGAELDAIEQEFGGIPAQSVVDRARVSGTALHEWDSKHKYFEWDDSSAAEEYRREQARALIRTVRITVETGDERLSVRGFLAVDDGARGRIYRSIGFVAVDSKAHEEVIRRFESEMLRIQQSYEAYLRYAEFQNRFGSVFLEVDKVIDAMAAEGDLRAKQLVRQRYRRDAQGNVALSV